MGSREYGYCGGKDVQPFHKDDSLDMIKSRLSCEYLSLICTYLDYEAHEPKPGNDRSGIDVTISPVANDPRWEIKPTLYFQLKATSVPTISNGTLKLRIDAKTYRKLRGQNMDGRTFVGVLCLPQETSQWVSVTAKELIMKEVMYWYQIKKGPELEDGKEDITLNIPLTNILDGRALNKMMEMTAMKMEMGDEI
ncbi:MAG: DUF4365 domain-containing protein [Candidatus Methanoplasma sp.]|jgi:hypothetical protein|nr:DUF4365 domain-containing protein [Candidatus Methanoplasma sp.]